MCMWKKISKLTASAQSVALLRKMLTCGCKDYSSIQLSTSSNAAVKIIIIGRLSMPFRKSVYTIHNNIF